MSRRKLQVVGYHSSFVDVEDDASFISFLLEMETRLKRKEDTWSTVLHESKENKEMDKRMEIVNQYLMSCGINPALSRRAIVNHLLDLVIDLIYLDKVSAHDLTSSKYRKMMESRSLADNAGFQLSRIDYSSLEVCQSISQLCRVLGLAEHPEPATSLKAACLFIVNNLNSAVIEERNKEVKEGVVVKTFDLKSFPLGMDPQKDGAVNAAARILRLLNIEAIRTTQTMVNETLVAVQNLTIDMSKKPDYKQVQYGSFTTRPR